MKNPLLIVLLSLVGVVGDALLKEAGAGSKVRLGLFISGFLVYSATAFGWYFALKYMKMADLGTIYGISTVFFLTAFGLLLFRETITVREVFGIVAGVISLLLLSRFA